MKKGKRLLLPSFISSVAGVGFEGEGEGGRFDWFLLLSPQFYHPEKSVLWMAQFLGSRSSVAKLREVVVAFS